MSEKLHRMVNGKRVELSAEEEAALREEWRLAAEAAQQQPRYVSVAELRERLEQAGKYEALVALLTPAQIFKLSTLKEGVDLQDPTVRQMLAAVGVDADKVL